MSKIIILISLLLSGCTFLDGGNRAVRKALKTETPYCNDAKTYCVKLIDLKDSKVKALEIRIKETSMTLSTYDKMADAVTLEDRYQYLVTGTLEPKTIDVQIVDVKGNDESVCRAFCGDYGQGNSGVIQDSMGVCICDNDEGRKAQEGYLRYLNIKPNFKSGQCIAFMLTSSGSTDMDDNLLGKPHLALSKNLLYTVDSVDEETKEYYMTQIVSKGSYQYSQEVRDMEHINNNYLRVRCPNENK